MPAHRTLNFSQQKGLFNPAAARPTTVIGVGSVGSEVVMMLAKLGVSDITVYDHDEVESHNLPMSAYGIGDLARYKVEALAERVKRETGVTISTNRKKYASEKLKGSVVCCVDKMQEREVVFAGVSGNPLVDVFVDTRVAGNLISVFAIRPSRKEDLEYYGMHFYSTDNALPPMCGRHGIITVSAVTAGFACTALTNVWTKGTTKRHVLLSLSSFFMQVDGRVDPLFTLQEDQDGQG